MFPEFIGDILAMLDSASMQYFSSGFLFRLDRVQLQHAEVLNEVPIRTVTGMPETCNTS